MFERVNVWENEGLYKMVGEKEKEMMMLNNGCTGKKKNLCLITRSIYKHKLQTTLKDISKPNYLFIYFFLL